MTSVTLVLMLCPVVAFCQDESDAPSINVFTDSETAGKGLLVVFPSEISISKKQPGKFTFRAVNTLEESVFLQVTGFNETWWILEEDDGIHGAGGASVVGRKELYQLMSAARYENGKALFIPNCSAEISGTLHALDKQLLSSWVGKTLEVSVTISGFYRSSKKSFCETVRVPVTIVK